MPALRAHRQQRHQLPGNVRRGFGLLKRAMARLAAPLLVATLFSAGAATTAAGENVGRWQQGLRRCRIQITTAAEASPTNASGTSHSCSSLRLDQLLEGLLTVRLVSVAAAESRPSQQLVFAGVLAEGSRAMRCNDGRCRPQLPLRMQVSAVAQNGFDPRGLALGLPASHLARGECLLERRRLRCSATGSGGLAWSAAAEL